MTNQTKIYLLGGLMVAWVGTVMLQYFEEPEHLTASNNHDTSLTEVASTSLGDLALANSEKNPPQPTTLSTPRNIFDPLTLYPPPAPSSKPRLPQETIRQPEPVQPKRLVPTGPSSLELARQRAEQQLQQFRFLGYLKKGGESQAFLTKGQSIYIVKQGATVEGTILVQRIDPTLIVLSTQILESGDHVKAEIPLSEELQRS